MNKFRFLLFTILVCVIAVRDRCENSWFNNICSDQCSFSSKRRWIRPHRPIRPICPDYSFCSRSNSRRIICPPRPPRPIPCNPCVPQTQVRCFVGGRDQCNYIFWELDSLSRCKEEELRHLFAAFIRKSLDNLSGLLKSLETLLNTAVNLEYTGLGVKINQAIDATNTANKAAISNLITNSSAALLTSVQSLITTANTALGQVAAQVIAGTIPVAQLPNYIATIMTALTNGVNTLFAQTAPQDVLNAVNLLNASTTSLELTVAGILSDSNTSLNAKINSILEAEFAVFTKALERQYGELLEAVERVFHSYTCEVRRLVVRSLGNAENNRLAPVVY